MVDRSIYYAGVVGPTRRTRTSILARSFAAVSVWRQRRHLADLDAHLRKDIGLRESDVAREVQRSIWDGAAHWNRSML